MKIRTASRVFPATKAGDLNADLWVREKVQEGFAFHPTKGHEAIRDNPDSVYITRWRLTMVNPPY